MNANIAGLSMPAAPRGDGLLAVSVPATPPTAVNPTPPGSGAGLPEERGRQEADRSELAAAAASMARAAEDSGADLHFRVDEDLGRIVVSIVDRRDGKVLRQLPSEEALRIAKALTEHEGHLVDAVV
ncbi:MAG TPA: flagellar protein FlaG [Solimonas sp.]|nr:flagellar protein FlaG [Solimonas sp.]